MDGFENSGIWKFGNTWIKLFYLKTGIRIGEG
jgi:hypothetical protein